MVKLLPLKYAFEQIHEALNHESSGRADLKFVRDNISDELEVSNERLTRLVDNARNIVDVSGHDFRARATNYRDRLPKEIFEAWKRVRAASFINYYIALRSTDKAQVSSVDDPVITDFFWFGECAVIALWPHTEKLPNRGRLPMHDWLNDGHLTTFPQFELGRELDDYEVSQLETLFQGVPENPTRWLDRKKSAFAAVQTTMDWLQEELAHKMGMAYRVRVDGTRLAIHFEEFRSALLENSESVVVSTQLVDAATGFKELRRQQTSQTRANTISTVPPPSPRRGSRKEIENACREVISKRVDENREMSESELLRELRRRFSNVSRPLVRDLRREMVPASWKKPGRRRKYD